MRRFLIVAGCLLALSMARSGQAENWFSTSWHDFWAATHRNNAWPEAFIPADRYAVRAPFSTCVANGWRAQNTLVDDHFDEQTGRLNEAGAMRVQSILTYTPPAYRTVFVLRGDSLENTSARMASVQEAAMRVVGPGEAPVLETNLEPQSTPAYYIVDVDRSFRESMPPPRLPPGTRSSGGSSSGSSGS